MTKMPNIFSREMENVSRNGKDFSRWVSCEGFKMSMIDVDKCKIHHYGVQFAYFPFCNLRYFCTFAASNLKIGIK